MNNKKKLYQLKNWIRDNIVSFGKFDKQEADKKARNKLKGWIEAYGVKSVLKAFECNIVCQGLEQFEDLIQAQKRLMEEEPKRREKMRKEMEQYQITKA